MGRLVRDVVREEGDSVWWWLEGFRREGGRELGRKERESWWLEVDSTEIFSVPKA